MIHVLGSINIDYGCQMQRLPGSGETVHADELALTPGGKGANQALAARRAGSEVAMHGAVGDDEVTEQALELLTQAGVDLATIRHVPGPTGCAFVFIDASGENQIVVLAGANNSVTTDQATQIPLQTGDILLLQMETPLSGIQAAARHARESGAITIASLAPYYTMPSGYFNDTDILLLNQHEGQLLCKDFDIDVSKQPAAKAIAMALKCSVVQTLGSNGVQGYDASTTTLFNLPGLNVDAIDTVGAGDTFAGYLGAMMDRNRSLQNSCKIANAAAAFACTRTGAQAAIPRLEELGELVGGHTE